VSNDEHRPATTPETDELPAPFVDPTAAAAFRELEQGLFGGAWPPLTMTDLPAVRAFSGDSLDGILAARDVVHTERSVPATGDAPERLVSVLSRPGDGKDRPGIYAIHGGGMVMGNRFGGLDVGLDIVEQHGAVLVSPEYRLAPENPDPAPADDCYAGLVWMFDHASELGIDPDRIVLVGTSAGGGLAAGVALRCRDEGGPKLAGQMLVCPMLDDRNDTPSVRQGRRVALWSREENEVGWHALLGDRHRTPEVSTYAAPARATDLSGLPPTSIDVGSGDLFRDEDVAYASEIWAAGGQATLHVWPGGFHGSETIAPEADISRDAVATRRQWLARRLGCRIKEPDHRDPSSPMDPD
jgi:acetyl esterase/lipase